MLSLSLSLSHFTLFALLFHLASEVTVSNTHSLSLSLSLSENFPGNLTSLKLHTNTSSSLGFSVLFLHSLLLLLPPCHVAAECFFTTEKGREQKRTKRTNHFPLRKLAAPKIPPTPPILFYSFLLPQAPFSTTLSPFLPFFFLYLALESGSKVKALQTRKLQSSTIYTYSCFCYGFDNIELLHEEKKSP